MIPLKEKLQKLYDTYHNTPLSTKQLPSLCPTKQELEYEDILKYYLVLLADNLEQAAAEGRSYSATVCTYRDFQNYSRLEKDIKEAFKTFDIVFYKQDNITIRIFWLD